MGITSQTRVTSIVMKKIGLLCIFLMLVAAVCANWLYKPELYWLKVNVQKYTIRNIEQNYGVHKFALKVLAKLSSWLPSYDHIDLLRDRDQIGALNYKHDPYINDFSYEIIDIESEDAFRAALKQAKPGQHLVFKPGSYFFDGSYLPIAASGEPELPIVIKAQTANTVTLNFNLIEGLLISGAYIKIENLTFMGAKATKRSIEHAIHLAGNADFTTIQNNQFINFNAHIKSNGKMAKDGSRQYPDNVKIINNNFYNEAKRNTTSPASPIDVVGGNNWLIAHNFIADFGKSGRRGRGATYGLFLKGASTNGIIENNLINCAWQVPHSSAKDIRIGISLGNGGTGEKFCPNGHCQYEHLNGKIRHNTIINCSNDVGIYINKGKETLISNNIIMNSLGIEVRYQQSSALITDNYLDGLIRSSKSATIQSENNQASSQFIPHQ